MSNPNSTSVSLRQAPEVIISCARALQPPLTALQNSIAQISRRSEDIEVAPKLQDGDLPDPYRIRAGLKTDDELSQLRRRRRTGKRLERFHRKQNDVSFSLIRIILMSC